MLLSSDIRHAINEYIEDLKNSLAKGGAGSYDSYQRIVGEIIGLEKGMELAIQVIAKRIESDEED